MKRILFKLFLVALIIVSAQEVAAQTITVTRDFLMKGLPVAFPKPGSIGLQTDGESGATDNIRVAVYAKDYYDSENKSDSFLYGFEARPNSGGDFDNLPYTLQAQRRKWWHLFKPVLETDPIQYYSTAFSSNSFAVYKRALLSFFRNQVAHWSSSDVNSPNNSLMPLSAQTKKFEKEIRVELTGTVEAIQHIETLNLEGLGGPVMLGEDLDPYEPDLLVDVYRDGQLQNTHAFFRNQPTLNPLLDLVIGDSVLFQTKHPRFNLPNLPEVWIARSAGESLYYCTKSTNLVRINAEGEEESMLLDYELNPFPFIGFDFQNDAAIVRGSLDGDVEVNTASITIDGKQRFSWTAQRRMDANLTDFTDGTNIFLDPAKHRTNFPQNNVNIDLNFTLDPNNIGFWTPDVESKIRNNKREGFNRQALFKRAPYAYFFNALLTNERPSLPSPYLSTCSPFEFLGDKNHSFLTSRLPWGVEYENWKKITPDVSDSFHENLLAMNRILDRKNTAGGWPTIDLFVSLFTISNTIALIGEDMDVTELGKMAVDYQGYEIQDHQVYQYYPVIEAANNKACNGKPCVRYDATGGGTYENVKAPGNIVFNYENRYEIQHQFPIKLNIESPLTTDHGFYGSLEGEQWPAFNQENVPYTLTGLQEMPANELERLVMEYSHENDLGILKLDTRSFDYTNFENGRWTEKFDMQGVGYNEVTVYYKATNTQNAEKVIIAGKELLEIELRYVSVPGSRASLFTPSGALPGIDLREGKGKASLYYLKDNFRTYYNDPNYGPAFGDLYKGIQKQYTFSQGDAVTFATLDGAPHTFFHFDVEWELSERTLAKRMYPEDLAQRIVWYLVPKGNGQATEVQYGQTFHYTFDTPGKYRLTTLYNNSSFFVVEILVKSEPFVDDTTSTKANISLYPLTPEQKRLLKDVYNLTDNSKVAKVEGIFSAFEAKTKNNVPLLDDPNATIDYKYHWKLDGADIEPRITLPFINYPRVFYTKYQTPLKIRAYKNMYLDRNEEDMNSYLYNYTEPYQERFAYEVPKYGTSMNGDLLPLENEYRLTSKSIVNVKKMAAFEGVNPGLKKYGSADRYLNAVKQQSVPIYYNNRSFYLDGFGSGKKIVFDPMANRGVELSTHTTKKHLEPIEFFVAKLKAEASEGALIHLEFENNLEDTSGNNTTSISDVLSQFSSEQTQQNSNSVYLDGLNRIAIDTKGQFSGMEFSQKTIAFWMRSEDTSGSVAVLENAHTLHQLGFALKIENGNLVAAFKNNNLQQRIHKPIVDNTWYHVALVFDEEEFEMYVNGTLVGTLSEGLPNVLPDEMVLFLGGDLSLVFPETKERFKGHIDDFYMYDKALSLTEVNQLIMSAVPNGYSNSQQKTSTKIRLETDAKTVLLYPNPTNKNEVLTLETHLEKAETITCMITDISGKTVASKILHISAGAHTTAISIRELKAGVYVFKILGNQLHTVHKIVVE